MRKLLRAPCLTVPFMGSGIDRDPDGGPAGLTVAEDGDGTYRVFSACHRWVSGSAFFQTEHKYGAVPIVLRHVTHLILSRYLPSYLRGTERPALLLQSRPSFDTQEAAKTRAELIAEAVGCSVKYPALCCKLPCGYRRCETYRFRQTYGYWLAGDYSKRWR